MDRPYEDRPTQAHPAARPDAPRADDPTRAQPAAAAPTQAHAAPGPVAPSQPRSSTPQTGATRGPRTPVQVRRLRRGRLAIRKVSPWATFKFSLVFYFCMLLIMLLGTALIFAALKAFGVIGNIEQLLRDLEFDVTIAGGAIFRWLFLLGLIGTVVASAITVFMAFLYNLISDVVGGIEILVTERE